MPAYSAARRWRAVAVGSCVLLSLALASGCSIFGGDDDAARPKPSPTVTFDQHVDDHSEDTQVVPPLAKASELAGKFSALWVRYDLTNQQWWNEISPLCERGFALRLHKSGRAVSPKLRITGPPKLGKAPVASPGTVVVTPDPSGVDLSYNVPVEDAFLVVNIGLINGSWLVVSVDYKRVVT